MCTMAERGDWGVAAPVAGKRPKWSLVGAATAGQAPPSFRTHIWEPRRATHLTLGWSFTDRVRPGTRPTTAKSGHEPPPWRRCWASC
jgi:hypothetical protein